MIELGGLFLLRPVWLLGLPLAGGAAWLAARRARDLAGWRGVIDPALLPALMRLGVVEPAARDIRPWLLGASAALLALALSGPATRRSDAPALRNLDAVMILLDLSPSIVEGGGLESAQAAVARLVDRRGTRPVALVLYAGESFLVSVPTTETRTLKSVVASIDAGTMPLAGSRPDRALALARTTLGDAASERADVVLVSDGGGLGPEAAHEARRLRAEGAAISAVFVAPRTRAYGAALPDRAALSSFASAGEGMMVDAADTGPLEARLSEQRGISAGEARRRELVLADHGRWLLIPAALLLLPLFRRWRQA